MSFLAGSQTLERLNQATSVSFAVSFACVSNTVPVVTIQPPANAVDLGFVFNTGAGTLLTGVTFAGTNTTANWTGGSILNPTFGLEIVDGLVAANGLVIYGAGIVTSVSNATTNLQQGTPFEWDTVTNNGYVSAGNGIALNIRAAIVATIIGYLLSMNGATSSTIKAAFRVLYVPRQ